jgi:putative peptidoglycan lipid II flippase
MVLNKIFHSQSKSVSSAAFLLGAAALISRLLGLLRDRLLAGRFGAGEELDIYFAAFRIPDFVYALLITGGISAVFLPVFSGIFQKNREEGWKFANNVLNIVLGAMIFLCAILALATPFIIHIVVPGFSPVHKELAVSLTRIMFLSPLLFGVASIFSGILHYFQKFLVYAIAPLLYNIGIIIGILFFVPAFGLNGLAYGVLLGAFLYLFIQIPAALYSGWRYQFFFHPRHPELIKTFTLMIPRIAGISAYQFNLLFLTALASTLGTGSIAVFNFSNNLQYIPIGLVGISFATAVFPVLSRSGTEYNKEKFLHHFSSTVRQVLFLVIPASVLLFLLRAHIVRLVLGTGQFGWLETRLTAASLGIFSFGIFASSIVLIAARAFFALQDTRTPALIGVTTVMINIVFSFLFLYVLHFQNFFSETILNLLDVPDVGNVTILALPLAISLSSILQLFLLLFLLQKKINLSIFKPDLKIAIQKILIASTFLGITTYGTLQFTGMLLNLQKFFGVFLQAAIAGSVGIIAYLIAAFRLNIQELATLQQLVFFVMRKRKRTIPVPEIPLE